MENLQGFRTGVFGVSLPRHYYYVHFVRIS